MNNSFPELREILKTGTIPEDISYVSEACHRRLLDALRNSPGSGDIVSLVRHLLTWGIVDGGFSEHEIAELAEDFLGFCRFIQWWRGCRGIREGLG